MQIQSKLNIQGWLSSLVLSTLAATLVACGSGSNSSTSSVPGNNGGLDCFATGATVASTTEGSGIALFYNAIMYPRNTNTGTPWTFLEPPALALNGTPSYNYTTCAAKYDTIINTVIAQDRNKNGTLNDGSSDSYAALKTALGNSLAPFVGLDNFYYSTKDLGLAATTGLTESAYKAALDAKCGGSVSGKDLLATGVCPNGTYMHNFLWRTNGLFTNSNATFVGVQSSDPVNGDAGLTWTRGYLLQKYSNKSPAPAVYTAIFDAGSSGTRVSFYKVTPGLKAGITPVVDTKRYRDSGINDFMNNRGTIEVGGKGVPSLPAGCPGTTNLGQDQVGPCVLQPLLDYVTANLPTGVTAADVNVELFATAGMRTEDSKNGGGFTTATIDAFYTRIKEYVKTTALSLNAMYSKVGDFKTINGNKEEGVWTWINLNDLRYNTFATQGACGAMIGDFEVGGSSMQVAFPVSNTTTPSDAANVYNVNINGCSVNVYSKSFLGLGGDDARKFMRAYNY